MADIRQSTAVLDDFARADEDPIANTAQYPWVTPVLGYGDMKLEDNHLMGTVAGAGGNWCYWGGDPYPQSGSAGDTPEIWAKVSPGSYSFPYGTRMGFINSSSQGYEVLETGGFSLIVRRYTGGGSFTDISGSIDDGDGVYTADQRYQLVRLTSTHVECWRTTSSDMTSWTLTMSVPDTTYRDGMYGVLGATGIEDGFSEFGGGGFRPIGQIYRWVTN